MFTKRREQIQHSGIAKMRFLFLTASILLALPFSGNTQEVLIGLTSNGGSAGRGTAFSIKTNGTGFSVIKGFADFGKAPNGDLFKNDDGTFLGMTSLGGTYNAGTIFSMTPAGAITVIKHLNSATDGATPQGELIKATDGNFYGVTSAGGANSYGTVFKLTPAGAYSVLRHLSYATDGTNPRGHLVQAKDGNFYGLTTGGGANGVGTIFKITPAGVFTVLRHFTKATDGSNSYGSLTLGRDSALYGITNSGGSFGYGTIFKITTSGTFTVLRHLNGTVDGGYSQSDLILGTDGNFYSMCYGYGTNGNGTIFKITPSGTYTVLRQLISSKDGGNPYGNLFQNNDGFLYGMTRTGGALTSGTAFKISTDGAFTLLHSFATATEGTTINGGFTKGNDGNLYALTSYGGTYTGGTAIKMTTAGAVTAIANFNGAGNGNAPFETLIKGKDSAYYGTTSDGGLYGYGTIFKICGGSLTTLFSFNRSLTGGSPKGSLVLANDGNFYGMTPDGGSHGYGTIFKISPSGSFSVIRHLAGATDGGGPLGSLIQAKDGLLYGMTNSGGSSAGGTIFKMTLSGTTFTVLRNLAYATDGANPEGSLVQGTDGDFYGMTGNNARIFKITSTGTFTILRVLNGTTDGYYPLGSLVQHSDGNFYGTNSVGGANGGGTIFKISPTGTYSVLRHLNAIPDGKMPKGDLLKAVDGNLYGMTSTGGTNNVGTLFKITTAGSFTVLRHFNMTADGGNPFGGLMLAPVNNNYIANSQSITTNEDTPKTITLTGSGGSSLSYNIMSSPLNGKITGTGPDRTYTPNLNFNGRDSFLFNAGVGCMVSTSAMVRITVNAIPDTPVLASIGNKSVTKNSTLTFKASATDGDRQPIAYSLVGAPAGASINATTGAFTWTPAITGSYIFKVRAADNGTPVLFDEEQITVTVTDPLQLTRMAQPVSINIAPAIYPNPVEDRFFVTVPEAGASVMIRIIQLNGIVVSSANYRSTNKNVITVEAGQLRAGTYIVQVQTAPENNWSLKMIKR